MVLATCKWLRCSINLNIWIWTSLVYSCTYRAVFTYW